MSGGASGYDLSLLVAQAGANSMVYQDVAFPGRNICLHAARPAEWSPSVPVVLVHHGVGRNGRDYRDYWLPHAEAFGLLVISIEYPQEGFPEYLWYNFGNLHTAEGVVNPRSAWTFGVGPRLFEALLAQNITSVDRYGVFGHSAGGQYVHRMLSFGYRDRVAVAVSANAGTYAMPDLGIDWPWGLGATEFQAEHLSEWLRFPLTIMAGTEDTKTTGRFFPKGPKSMLQGPHRYGRARNYWRIGEAAARQAGCGFAWEVIDVPGVGHDGARMSDAAAPIIAERLRSGC